MYPEFAETFCKNLTITYNLRDDAQSLRKKFDRHKLLRMSSSLNKDRYTTPPEGENNPAAVRRSAESVSRCDSNPIDRRQSAGSRSEFPFSASASTAFLPHSAPFPSVPIPPYPTNTGSSRCSPPHAALTATRSEATPLLRRPNHHEDDDALFDDIRAFARGNTVTMAPTVAGNSVQPTLYDGLLSGKEREEAWCELINTHIQPDDEALRVTLTHTGVLTVFKMFAEECSGCATNQTQRLTVAIISLQKD